MPDYKRLFISFELSFNEDDGLIYWNPVDNDKTIQQDNAVRELVEQGYKIVGTVPTTASLETNNEGVSVVRPFTQGIEVFLVKD